MELFGFDLVYLTGAVIMMLGALVLLLTLVGLVLVVLFWRTRRVFIPWATLFIVSLFEVPLKHVIFLFKIDSEFIDQMVTNIRNILYAKAYADVEYNRRLIFFPQCLRSPDCPAKLNSEGIECVNCGRCGIGDVKEAAEKMGYKFFIVPGSSFIRRMVKKYRPGAVLGVGCSMEVKEGMEMIASVGLPVQSVTLLRDGCVNTRVDSLDLMDKIMVPLDSSPEVRERWEAIGRKWV